MKKTLTLLGMLALTPLAKGQLLLEALDAPDVPSITLPTGITIDNGQKIIASIFDTDYLPYSVPTSLASWNTATNIVADGQADKTIDVQGKITTTGITVYIPVKTTGSGTVPAYKTYVNIPAERTEDGQGRVLELSWENQAFTTSTKSIKATIKALGGDLNVKKLDLIGGLGSDYKGLELGTFVMPQSATDGNLPANYKGKYELRVISGIPDKNFANKTIVNGEDKGYLHQFIYLPIQGPDGKIWLNNNLGADYANVNSPHFNPEKQAESYDDYKAYGSLYQWQRYSDGHELITWISSTTGTAFSGITSIRSNNVNWTAGHSNFIIAYNGLSWVNNSINSSSNNKNLWHTNGNNNPCSLGFHVPTKEEWDELKIIGETNDHKHYWVNSSLKLPSAGVRNHSDGRLFRTVDLGVFWSTTEYKSNIQNDNHRSHNFIVYHRESSALGADYKTTGLSIRCIKD